MPVAELSDADVFGAPASPSAVVAPAAREMTDDEVFGASTPAAGQNEYGITGDPQQFNEQKPGLSISFPRTADEARALLAEKPGYTASNMLPLRVKNDANGQADPSLGVELDLGPLRTVGNAAIDLMDGPRTGTVTPAGSQLLFGAMTGGALAPSIARGTGAAIADTVDYGAPKAQLYARPQASDVAPVQSPLTTEPPTTPAMVQNPAAQAVNAPAFVPPGSTIPAPPPAFVPPDARAPVSTVVPPTMIRASDAAENQLSSYGASGTSQPANALLGPPPAIPSSVAAPSGVPAAPATQSVGAAASRDLTHPSAIAMSPREAAASQATGENWRLSQPAVQGVDKTEYVKGVVPTAAEVAGNADVSAQQKYVMQTPGQAERYRAQQAANNDARIDHYDDLAGTPTIVDTLKEARSAQADADLNAAWGNKAPVDAQPIVDQIDAVLAGPQGKLSAVSSALNKVRDTLHDADGNLETDPEVLYGARREVAAMLGKAAQQEKPTLKDAASQLGSVKDALDQTIEQGAPGYGQYLTNYTNASRPINVRELLLDARPGLTSGSDRTMSFAKMDRLMRDIVAKRQSAGANPAKSIDDATMEGLWNLHSDLKRLGNIDLGKPRGSDTSALGRMGGALGLGAAHIGANALLPVAGSFLVNEGKNVLASRSLSKRVNKLMDGPNYRP